MRLFVLSFSIEKILKQNYEKKIKKLFVFILIFCFICVYKVLTIKEFLEKEKTYSVFLPEDSFFSKMPLLTKS